MQNVHTTAFILVQTSHQHAVRQKAFIAAMIATPEDYSEMASTEKKQPADDDDDVAKGNVYEGTEKEEPPAYETVKLLYYAN